MNELTFLGIDHPSIAANHVEQLADWYCDVFGYEKWFKHENPSGCFVRRMVPCWK